jgi:hypothetical protein
VKNPDALYSQFLASVSADSFPVFFVLVVGLGVFVAVLPHKDVISQAIGKDGAVVRRAEPPMLFVFLARRTILVLLSVFSRKG